MSSTGRPEVLTLSDLGFAVGDLVTYRSDKESTGGIVFVISKNFDSPVPTADRPRWSTRHSYKNEKGKELKAMEIAGYVRLRPVFSFFPTDRGEDPKGLNGTVLVYHTSLTDRNSSRMKKVDIVTLGTRYAELGNLLHDLAKQGGMLAQTGLQE